MIRTLLASLICLMIAQTSEAKQPNIAEQPNIVVIMADDCTFRDIGCYGGQARTPNIDRLATEGIRMDACFQAAPMCSPTRHNLYTGLYPVRTGAYPNHAFADEGTRSIAHFLKPLGYRVALSGKKHIASRKIFPFEYSGRNNPDMKTINRFMKDCKESKKPFCLFACSNEPHSPWNKGDASRYPADQIKLPPYLVDTDELRENFSRYLAEITYFDHQVGQILKLIEKHGLTDETIVVVLSEQGNAFPFAKWTCYGNGLQSAMVVRWPGKIKPKTTSKALVEYVDVVPTLVEAAGGKPESLNLDGKSMLAVLSGEREQHKDLVYGIMTTRGINQGSDIYPIRTVRDRRYRLVWNLNHQATFQNACSESKVFQSMREAAKQAPEAERLVKLYQHRPEFELFDCQADPLEMTNLAKRPEHQKTLSQLKTKLQKWMKEQGDQGIQTEIEAIFHLKRNAGKPREQVLNSWKSRKKKMPH